MSMPHVCTVQHETSRTYLPFSSESKNPFHKFCRFFRHSTMVWKHHPRFSYYYRSTTAYLNERKMHATGRYFYIIHPLSKMCFFTEMILMITYPLAFAYFPLIAIFHRLKGDYRNHDILEEYLQYTFTAEIFIRFFVGRQNAALKEVTLSHPQIIRMYVSSPMFFADLCGALPLISISHYIRDPNILHGVAAIRFIKAFRIKTLIHYVYKFLTILGLSFYSGVSNFFIITFFYFHWCACLYYGIPRLRAAMTGNFDYGKTIIREFKVKNGTLPHYIESAWRSMGMLITARRDIRMFTGLEQKIACFVFLIAGKLFMLILGVILINQILRYDELKTKYREVLGQLNEFMTHKKLPMATRQRLLAFYEYKFQGKFVKEAKIQNILSDRLKKEINFHNSNKLVKQVEMFEDIPTKILAEILSNLKIEVFLPNDIIIRAGSPAESMYFISNGTVCVTTASGREVCHLQDGGYFGEAALVLNHKKSISNVTALEICETFRLDYKTFRSCFKKYPEILNNLRAIAEMREKETLKLEEEFQEKLFLKTYKGDHDRDTVISNLEEDEMSHNL